MGPGARFTKRVVDVAVSGAALIIAAPVVGAAALAVRCQMGSPVLFRQQRPGLDGAPFTMVKLRTMLTEEQAGSREDGRRLTPLGAFLRSTSIDEIPTLWNVLRGEMSLVGPRPLLMEYLPLYTPAQAHRHDVLPGLTGLAQVRGRNALTWEDKFEADLEYVNHQSVAMDVRILMRTVALVLSRRGINHQDAATMPMFGG